MKTAYLIAHINTTTRPPSVVSCHIYSEKAGSLTVDPELEFPLGVASADGHDYGEACENLLDRVNTDLFLHWVKPLLRRR